MQFYFLMGFFYLKFFHDYSIYTIIRYFVIGEYYQNYLLCFENRWRMLYTDGVFMFLQTFRVQLPLIEKPFFIDLVFISTFVQLLVIALNNAIMKNCYLGF